MSVTVQNIYYLLCYAWDRLEARNLVDVTSIPGNRIENLLGKVLHDGVAHLIRSGFDRGYVSALGTYLAFPTRDWRSRRGPEV